MKEHKHPGVPKPAKRSDAGFGKRRKGKKNNNK